VTEPPPKPPPQSLSKERLKKAINDALLKGYFSQSHHAVHDHPERNISVDDVLHGLKLDNWTLETSEFDEKHGRWKYKIKTEDIEGDELCIVFSCWMHRGRSCIRVITRW
jgi:hypothetical protein